MREQLNSVRRIDRFATGASCPGHPHMGHSHPSASTFVPDAEGTTGSGTADGIGATVVTRGAGGTGCADGASSASGVDGAAGVGLAVAWLGSRDTISASEAPSPNKSEF